MEMAKLGNFLNNYFQYIQYNFLGEKEYEKVETLLLNRIEY